MNKFKILALILVSCLTLGIAGCGGGSDKKEQVVYVYSWGDYLNPEVLKLFEKETGIHVILDEFDTNESMYPRVAEGAVHYDVLCPSDYMIQKLISNDLIQPLDFTKLPDAKKYIGEECRIAGELSELFTTRQKSLTPLTAGISFGTKNTKDKF